MKTASRSAKTVIAAGVLALAGCATVQLPPNDAFQAADIAISNAENDHAADYAPLEMRTAHEKISAARADSQQSDEVQMAQARPLADEARVEADLASAKAHLGKAEAVNQELQKNNSTLNQEIQRGSGG